MSYTELLNSASKCSALVIAICSLLAGCASEPIQDDWGAPNSLSNNVSAVELVANGRAFNNWNVSVIGVAYFSTEDTLLFLNMESYENFDSSSAVLIDLQGSSESLRLDMAQLESLNGRYILIEGVYEHIPRRQLQELEYLVGPDYAGAISEVNRITLAK